MTLAAGAGLLLIVPAAPYLIAALLAFGSAGLAYIAYARDREDGVREIQGLPLGAVASAIIALCLVLITWTYSL